MPPPYRHSQTAARAAPGISSSCARVARLSRRSSHLHSNVTMTITTPTMPRTKLGSTARMGSSGV